MKDEKFLVKELEKKDYTHDDAVKAVRAWHVVHTDTGGYVSEDITYHLFDDGAMTMSENDGDGFIHLSADQVKIVMSLLNNQFGK